MNKDYYLPVNIVFGRGRVAEVGRIASHYGKRAMLVTGANSVRKSGLFDRVIRYLKEAGMTVELYDKVSQNPLTSMAEEGALLAKATGCEVVIGVGGGSIMDCAKAIAFLVKNPGDISDYIYGKSQGESALPLVLVPTTCGTGSEGNGFAVLTNKANGDKKSLRSNAIIAKASIVDSELMETMPKSLLATVGFDAFCHCLEAYVSRQAQPITDALATQGLELISQSLVLLYQENGELKKEKREQLWDTLSMASTLGGMAIYNAGVGLAHGMEHPASGLKDIVHGKGLAALTPVIVEASQAADTKKYGVISRILGGKNYQDCGQQIRHLLEELDLTTSLSKLGILSKDIPWMTENSLKVSAASISNHPMLFSKDEIYQLYYRAL